MAARNRKIVVTPQWIDQFWQNLAWWCLSANKILKIQVGSTKTIKAISQYLYKCKNRSSTIPVNGIDRFSRNFARWCMPAIWITLA